MRSGGNRADIAEAADVLRDLLPHHRFTTFRTRPCLVAATLGDRPHRGPWPDSIPHEVFRAEWADASA